MGVIPPHKLYTRSEEIANSITHGLGAGLSVAGLTLLVVLAVLRGNIWHIVSFSIYGSTLVILYLASTLYHSLRLPKIKRIFQIIDHSAIYLLIAGTYTPILLVRLRDSGGWILLSVAWGLAFLGISYKILYINRYQRLSAVGYVLMGWLFVFGGKAIFINLPRETWMWVAIGGSCYLLGLIFASWQRLRYSHTIWHVFVLGGSVSHYFAILYLLPGGMNNLLCYPSVSQLINNLSRLL